MMDEMILKLKERDSETKIHGHAMHHSSKKK